LNGFLFRDICCWFTLWQFAFNFNPFISFFHLPAPIFKAWLLYVGENQDISHHPRHPNLWSTNEVHVLNHLDWLEKIKFWKIESISICRQVLDFCEGWQPFLTKNYGNSRPFPNCFVPCFQSEASCKTFHMKMSFIYMWMKTHFHMKGYTPRLALQKRYKTTRKWPIKLPVENSGVCSNSEPINLFQALIACSQYPAVFRNSWKVL